MKKQFLILFAFVSVLAFSQAPQRFNKVIVTGDITSPKFIKTGSNADSVLLGNGSARSVNSIKTDTVSLSNRINAKATGSGTASGTNTGDETLTTIKTKLGAATSVSDGYLKYQDWNTFNSKEPAISKKSGFNLPLGTTTGTVLEGRTFGTAANSAVGDFIQNGAGVQAANFNINGSGALGAGLTAKAVSANIQLVLGRTGDMIGDVGIGSNSNNYIAIYDTGTLNNLFSIVRSSGASSFSSTINATGFLLNGNNLTSNLSANHVVKWNGTNMVNSGIYDNAFWGTVNMVGTGYSYDWAVLHKDATGIIRIPKDTYNVEIPSTTPSTSPTTGALVVGGGIGANHVRANQFYGDGSTLTGVQLPLTLTTNGTSGAATFSGNVINIPNYSSNSVNQTLTTVNGSTGGDIVGSMPFQTANYKKVIVYVNFVSGNATYTFPTQFNNEYNLHTNTLGTSYSSVSVSGTSVTITGATNAAGVLIIEGY